MQLRYDDKMRALAFSGLVLLTAGCLGSQHVIPKGDLIALSQTDPQTRGEQVRVIQGYASDDGPPPAPEVHSGAVIIIAPVPDVTPGPTHSGRRARVSRGGRTKALAKAKADDAKAWIVVAALVAVGLAVTEGARYDGWVRLHPMHPVHIYGPGGHYSWVPLAQLDPETARWARKAYVRDTEGPWQHLGRAPLNRRGLTYSVFLGGSEFISADGSDNSGFLSHIQFGFYPMQTFGVQLDFGLGWADNLSGDTIFDSRWALELDLLPVSAGPFHAGVYGQAGMAARFEDGPSGQDKSDVLIGAGAKLQLELTTRLAITARAGLSRLYENSVADVGVGISIY